MDAPRLISRGRMPLFTTAASHGAWPELHCRAVFHTNETGTRFQAFPQSQSYQLPILLKANIENGAASAGGQSRCYNSMRGQFGFQKDMHRSKKEYLLIPV